MRKLSLILVIFSLLTNASNASTYSTEPQQFINELAKDLIGKLSDKNLTKEQKESFIEKIAIENVDINALGLYTLGELRNSLDENTKAKYQKTFEKYFLKNLTSRLTDYSSNKFEIIGADKKSANYTIVKTKIAQSEKQPEVKIDWRVYTKNPEKPLVRDLIVEGLSLARTQKEEFASILNSNDGDLNILFKTLEEFSTK